jgi:hypothetical protein
VQAPFTQVLPNPQILPHFPQFLESLVVFMQRPLHRTSGERQVQVPFTQTLPNPQVLSQPPQLLESPMRLVQVPLHLVWPEGQAGLDSLANAAAAPAPASNVTTPPPRSATRFRRLCIAIAPCWILAEETECEARTLPLLGVASVK